MKIHELFDDVAKWTRRRMAKDCNGEGCMSTAPEAVCWCLGGAIQRCYPKDEHRAVVLKITRHLGIIDAEDLEYEVSYWNDQQSRTFEEVQTLVKVLNIGTT